MDKNDLAISSRITDFNVQISAVNIHSHCSQMFGQNCKFNLNLCYFMIVILKNNLWSFKQMRFCDQTHGRPNRPIYIIIFFFDCPLNIMVQ